MIGSRQQPTTTAPSRICEAHPREINCWTTSESLPGDIKDSHSTQNRAGAPEAAPPLGVHLSSGGTPLATWTQNRADVPNFSQRTSVRTYEGCMSKDPFLTAGSTMDGGDEMARLGYARVSSAEQGTPLQIRDLEAAGASGASATTGSAGQRGAGRSGTACSTESAAATRSSCGRWTGSGAPAVVHSYGANAAGHRVGCRLPAGSSLVGPEVTPKSTSARIVGTVRALSPDRA
jgi:hypothetical protein